MRLHLDAPALGWLVVGALACALALGVQSGWVTATGRMREAECVEALREHARWLPVTLPDGTIAWKAPPVAPVQAPEQDTTRRRYQGRR